MTTRQGQTTITRPQILASVLTALITLLIVLWLLFAHLTISRSDDSWPPRHDSEIALEEYVPLEDIPMSPVEGTDESAEAYLPEDAANESQCAPASGNDLSSQGAVGDPAPTVTSEKPSPVKAEAKPTAQELADENRRKEEERIRRQTSSSVAGAFTNTGKNNANSGNTDKGSSGSTKGTAGAQSANGEGTGTVGGGWVMPNYNPVPSPVTGSVNMTVKIDAQGNVTSVTITGGEAPAGTNDHVKAACMREVRAHKFTRKSNAGDAPQTATAYITYIFK